jgi:hypothetical protein
MSKRIVVKFNTGFDAKDYQNLAGKKDFKQIEIRMEELKH